jgi:Ribbon-helix-helix protein, copG family
MLFSALLPTAIFRQRPGGDKSAHGLRTKGDCVTNVTTIGHTQARMPDIKTETVTFRIDSALKHEFAEIAQAEHKPVGELLRDLVREHIKQKRRREFEAEARRQSLECAAAAQDPNSDEARVTREMEAHFADVMREWK